MGLFGATHQLGLPPKICHTYPAMVKLGTVIPYKKKFEKYINLVIQAWVVLITVFFTGNQ